MTLTFNLPTYDFFHKESKFKKRIFLFFFFFFFFGGGGGGGEGAGGGSGGLEEMIISLTKNPKLIKKRNF